MPPAKQPIFVEFSTASFGNLIINSKLSSHGDGHTAIMTIKYIFQILNNTILYLIYSVQKYFPFDTCNFIVSRNGTNHYFLQRCV